MVSLWILMVSLLWMQGFAFLELLILELRLLVVLGAIGELSVDCH